MCEQNACITCGACCAFFRVSFYWGDCEVDGKGVPSELTEKLNDFLVCMKGTNQKQARCVALTGEIGQQVACSIYADRSSTCRAFDADSDPESECSKARHHWGLPPIPQWPQAIEVA